MKALASDLQAVSETSGQLGVGFLPCLDATALYESEGLMKTHLISQGT